MEYFPLFLRLTGRPVLVVGGGEVAARKITLLLAAGADITVVAPILCGDISALARAGRLTSVLTEFVPTLIYGRQLVVAATDDEAINNLVADAARAAGILVNVVDNPRLSSCIVPAIIDRDPVLVACSTGGSAPVLATELRSQIEVLLPARLGELAAFARRHRESVKAAQPNPSARRGFWLNVVRGDIAAAVLNGDSLLAETLLAARLTCRGNAQPRGNCTLSATTPSDPDQIKLGLLRALFGADLIVHDHDVAPRILTLGRRDARRLPLSEAHCPGIFNGSRLPLLQAASREAQRVVYLSTQPAHWVNAVAENLRAVGVLTQVW